MGNSKALTAVVGLGGLTAITLVAIFASPSLAAVIGGVTTLAGMFTKQLHDGGAQ